MSRQATRGLIRARAFAACIALCCCGRQPPQAPVRVVDTRPVELGLTEGWIHAGTSCCAVFGPLQGIGLIVEGRARGLLLLRLVARKGCTHEYLHDYGEVFGWRPGEELRLPGRLAASTFYPWPEPGERLSVSLEIRDVGINAFELAQLHKQLSIEGVPTGLLEDAL